MNATLTESDREILDNFKNSAAYRTAVRKRGKEQLAERQRQIDELRAFQEGRSVPAQLLRA